MPRVTRLVLILFVGISLVASGCQKLNKEMDIEVNSGEWKFYTIDGFQSAKQVTVNATAATNPILVVVMPGGEPDEKALAMNFGKGALAKIEKPSKEVNLTADVPAKTNFTVCIFADKKTKVQLKITSN